MRNPILPVRLAAGLIGAVALLAVPVVTPVWAAPRPVSPALETTPLSGVDAAAGSGAPAYDPRALRAEREASGPASAIPRADGSNRPAVLTGELSRKPFVVAGVTWRASAGKADPVVQVRLREAGGWTDWEHLDTVHGPDDGSADANRAAGRVASEPLFTASADAAQVRVDSLDGTVPEELSLMTIDPGRSPADANLSGAPSRSARAAVNRPGIYTRAQWGADESLRNCTATYSPTIKVGFVHHTAGSNSYSPGDSAAIVRGIYAYHVNGNGWCDVGYNFLADRFGQIFEGRAGGWDRPVIGAHTGGFNYNSFAVSAMGNFSTTGPPQVMLNAIASVLGWKLGMHGRTIGGTDVLVSAGGPTTKYPAGTAVSLNVVSGHRDTGYTDCPGGYLYAQLPNLRVWATAYLNANYRVDEDLYAVITDSTGSGRVEVHGLAASSGFTQRILDVATTWAAGDYSQWRFFMGSRQGDTRPDLIGVQAIGTASGHAEVRVATGVSNYQATVSAVSPLGQFPPDQQWQIAVGGPSGSDLYFLWTLGSGSGTVEVHGVSAASGYTQWNLHTTTALPSVFPGTGHRFFVARESGDLYLVMHGSSGSGRCELHALSAASGYQSFTEHSMLPIGYSVDWAGQWVIGGGSRPDVFYVPTFGTASGVVEVHRLSPANSYTAWVQSVATPYQWGGFPTWQYGTG